MLKGLLISFSSFFFKKYEKNPLQIWTPTRNVSETWFNYKRSKKGLLDRRTCGKS